MKLFFVYSRIYMDNLTIFNTVFHEKRGFSHNFKVFETQFSLLFCVCFINVIYYNYFKYHIYIYIFYCSLITPFLFITIMIVVVLL